MAKLVLIVGLAIAGIGLLMMAGLIASDQRLPESEAEQRCF